MYFPRQVFPPLIRRKTLGHSYFLGVCVRTVSQPCYELSEHVPKRAFRLQPFRRATSQCTNTIKNRKIHKSTQLMCTAVSTGEYLFRVFQQGRASLGQPQSDVWCRSSISLFSTGSFHIKCRNRPKVIRGNVARYRIRRTRLSTGFFQHCPCTHFRVLGVVNPFH